MIGHSRPLFFGFKGGKGVLVGAGAALATEPLVCVVLLVLMVQVFQTVGTFWATRSDKRLRK